MDLAPGWAANLLSIRIYLFLSVYNYQGVMELGCIHGLYNIN